MFAVTVTFSVRLGQMHAFLAEVERMIAAATADHPFDAWVLSDPTRPGKAMLVQIFGDSAAFDLHRTSREVRDFDSRVVDMVTNRAISSWSGVARSSA